MRKGLALLLTCAICLTSNVTVFANHTFANQNVSVEMEDMQFIGDLNDSSYYLHNNELMKVTVEDISSSSKAKSTDNINENKTMEKEILIHFYKTDLTNDEKKRYVTSRTGSLDMYDTAMNPMGNIKAKLLLTYSFNKYNGQFHLCKATGTYETIINEGIVPQSSELYWSVIGAIYRNGSFVRNGTLGDSEDFDTPTFSNIQLMNENESVVDVVTAGATYTLYCTRGVTINVYIPIDSNKL